MSGSTISNQRDRKKKVGDYMNPINTTCCICGKRLPGEKAMYYRGNWYCRDCEEILFDDALEEFRRNHYKKVGDENDTE